MQINRSSFSPRVQLSQHISSKVMV